MRPKPLLLLLPWAAASGAAPPLPPYAKAIRCAGLAEAAGKRLDPASAEGGMRFDHALFWGLAAADAAKAAKLTAARFGQDQRDAATLATRQLEAGDAAAKAALEACDKEVPPIE